MALSKLLLGYVFLISLFSPSISSAQETETLPLLTGSVAPSNFQEMWDGFDPRAEPLEVETIKEWEQEDVVMRIVRFRIGVFKGQKAVLAGIYGFPKNVDREKGKLPGLLQIHGGGQYAHFNAVLTNAKRGYATVSIAWAGRIAAPYYQVDPKVVKLFWDDETDDPNYKLTTDWGAVDGYHAPSRNAGNVFPSVAAHQWTLDAIESPRNCPWFLCALASRRALTFLERQPEVDGDRLGVYGHSMGGKLTVMTAVDSRVKAAAPSCGGISDRQNKSELFRSTIGDEVSLKQIACPLFFLSPSNDFHGRIGDLSQSVQEIKTSDWRLTCSPHHNHQDTAEYSVATQLWFDQHLKKEFECPRTPDVKLSLKSRDGIPRFEIQPDESMPIRSVHVYYTQQGKSVETNADMLNTKSRFWHHAAAVQGGKKWTSEIPVASVDKPLWVYANVEYELPQPITGAGYYYATYKANSFKLSSVLQKVTSAELKENQVEPKLKPRRMIEDFVGDWKQSWFNYKGNGWQVSTHKIYSETYAGPKNATLALQVQSSSQNKLLVMLDNYVAEINVLPEEGWQNVELSLADFKNFAKESLSSWSEVKTLKFSDAEHLHSMDRSQSRIVGKPWSGDPPKFRNLRWIAIGEPDLITESPSK